MVGQDPILKQEILEWLHSSPQGGHSGIQATYHKIKALFWWKNLINDVTNFIKQCDTCAHCKYEAIASPRLLLFQYLAEFGKVLLWILLKDFLVPTVRTQFGD